MKCGDVKKSYTDSPTPLSSQNQFLIDQIISIRQQYRLKLPDAIIVAMAKERSATLVTRDIKLNRITDITIVDW